MRVGRLLLLDDPTPFDLLSANISEVFNANIFIYLYLT